MDIQQEESRYCEGGRCRPLPGYGPSLRRYDISDPSKPRLVAEVDLDGAVVDMVLEDDWLAVSHMESDSRNRASSAITVTQHLGYGEPRCH